MMTEANKLRFKLKTSELVDIWQNFCESHTKLYDLTCDEYMHLLESDIDLLEVALEEKNTLLESISVLDNKRTELLEELSVLSGNKYETLTSFVDELRAADNNVDAKQLESLNLLLLDIILKIQDQNKKNQLFLNKAIHSLQDLRQSFSGKKSYKTYGADGATKATVTP